MPERTRRQHQHPDRSRLTIQLRSIRTNRGSVLGVDVSERTPLTTIGITAFNAVGTIADAVTSALQQRWAPIEVVVVDDASTDGTATRLEELSAADDRIRLIRHERNQGAAATRNTIVRHARGEFIAFFDDDDYSLPDRVTAQVDRLTAYEARFADGQRVACYAAREGRFPDGRTLVLPVLGTDTDMPGPHGPDLVAHLMLGLGIAGVGGEAPACSLLARRTTFEHVGGFDPHFRRCDDTEFNVRLARSGGHLIGVRHPHVRQLIAATGDKPLWLERSMHLGVLEKHASAIADPWAFAAARRWLHARYDWFEGEHAAAARHLGMAFVLKPGNTATRAVRALPNLRWHRGLRRAHASFGLDSAPRRLAATDERAEPQ